MRNLARLFAAVLIAAFAAGMAAHAAGATVMSLRMSAAAMADGGMADCQNCPDKAGKAACGQACLTPLAAITTAAGADFQASPDAVSTRPLLEFGGRTGPPEPYPPRPTILN